ncbi:MAG: cysteine desulfurase [Bacteroidota bacterium]|jgi:cysteine desulfurase/selenocysteine lyase|nr:cysteine desulfurase [Bacteroidota bacterium]
MWNETASSIATVTTAAFDPTRVRADFPILARPVRGKPLVYLDSAASTQKPRVVIDTLAGFYGEDYSNVHRGVHFLSQRATDQYEAARGTVRDFLNAERDEEIIFVRGTTEAINLVAQTYGRANFGPGDEIIVSAIEHHANIVPWQMLCEQTGAVLRVIPMNERGELRLEEFESMLGPRSKFVSVVHVSNALGTVNPVETIIEIAHRHGVPVLVDGAQSVQHLPIDVRALDADFFTFSGHKIYGPTGIGVLYGKKALLDAMPPYQGGGDMILSVSFERTVYNEVPFRFEAGTPNIAGAIGLAAALRYFRGFDVDAVASHEQALLRYATERLQAIDALRIIGTAEEKASVLSFTLCAVHPHDIGTILDQHGIAVRAGHHCAQPVMQFFGIPATARASFAMYNTTEDVDALVHGIEGVLEVFA